MKGLKTTEAARNAAMVAAQFVKVIAFAFFDAASGKGAKTAYAYLEGTKGGGSTTMQRIATMAALIASGGASMTKAGRIEKGAGFSPQLFIQLASPSAYGYHKRNGNIDDSGLTSAGVNFFQGALNGEMTGGWNAEAESATTRALAAAMIKGGKVHIKSDRHDIDVKLDCKHEVIGYRKATPKPTRKRQTKAKAEAKAEPDAPKAE